MPPACLTPQERRFTARVLEAAFGNPFSDERNRTYQALAEASSGSSTDSTFQAVSARLADFSEGLIKQGRGRVQAYAPEDRDPLRITLLFDVFHRYLAAFDGLIEQQVESGDASCAVPFAREALAGLERHGFNGHQACRYFAMFFQLRRAFFFINRALIGDSAIMKGFRAALWNNVFTSRMRLYDEHLWNRMEDFSTLLLGETGTGKGAAATAIGRSGFIPFDTARRTFKESFTRSFIAINLSQYPESLIESELFGHRKGAFTGAVEAHEGVLARCSPHGAIFLDEIGDVAVPVQIKLLQVLEQRLFSPVGSHERRQFRGRIIAATNRPIDDLRRDALFRDDFFYRLCSDEIRVPPLRERLRDDAGELEGLVSLTLRRLLGRTDAALATWALETIVRDLGADYAWPGNVRELEQCVRRVLLTGACRPNVHATPDTPGDRILSAVRDGDMSSVELLSDYCRLLHSRHGTYEAVARVTGLDRRTVKKYIVQ